MKAAHGLFDPQGVARGGKGWVRTRCSSITRAMTVAAQRAFVHEYGSRLTVGADGPGDDMDRFQRLWRRTECGALRLMRLCHRAL